MRYIEVRKLRLGDNVYCCGCEKTFDYPNYTGVGFKPFTDNMVLCDECLKELKNKIEEHLSKTE